MRASVVMLPRLTAEESLSMADRIAVGTGSLKREAANRLINAWQRAAQGQEKKAAQRATPNALIAMGIGYEVVPNNT